jgi:integration host factor subunit alpha
VKVHGFGKFDLRDKRERAGRNPQTGERIKIEERRVLAFKSSGILREMVNGRPEEMPDGNVLPAPIARGRAR